MQTEKPIIHWEDLFDTNGIPHGHFQTVIDQSKTPLIDYPTVPNSTSEKDHSIILWNQQTPESIYTRKNVDKFLANQLKNKNGTAHAYSFSGIELPVENRASIKRKLELYAAREKRRDLFGEWLWQQYQESHFNIHALTTLIMNIKFELVYTKHDTEDTIKKLDTINIHHDDGGIYLVAEHVLDSPYYRIVYVGKSFGAMGTTMWCHFNEWGKKYHPGIRPKGSRGEDRGMWREKIMEGYSYSVGLIKILPEQEGFPGITHQQLLDLEKKLIQVFSPRDNIKDKLYSNENHIELFDSNLVEGTPPPPEIRKDDDTTPF